MSESRIIKFAHNTARSIAAELCRTLPDGWVAKFSEPTRNLEQNALLWCLLTCFSEQLQWPINGVMSKLTPEEFKDILSAAFSGEQARVSPSLDGRGMVFLGLRTSKMGKRRFAEFIEFIYATGADRGVNFERQDEHERRRIEHGITIDGECLEMAA